MVLIRVVNFKFKLLLGIKIVCFVEEILKFFKFNKLIGELVFFEFKVFIIEEFVLERVD